MRTLAAVMVVLGVALALAPRASAQSAAQCVKSWSEARFNGVGYNHLVYLANSCDAEAECVVSTDVNPEAQRVAVPGHEEVVVNTFLGSPARAFTPKVACRMH
jgi:hypothetical protein